MPPLAFLEPVWILIAQLRSKTAQGRGLRRVADVHLLTLLPLQGNLAFMQCPAIQDRTLTGTTGEARERMCAFKRMCPPEESFVLTNGVSP